MRASTSGFLRLHAYLPACLHVCLAPSGAALRAGDCVYAGMILIGG